MGTRSSGGKETPIAFDNSKISQLNRLSRGTIQFAANLAIRNVFLVSSTPQIVESLQRSYYSEFAGYSLIDELVIGRLIFKTQAFLDERPFYGGQRINVACLIIWK